MATVEEVRQRVQQQQQAVQRREQEIAEAQKRLSEARKKLPKVTTQEALRKKYPGMQGRLYRQRVQKAQREIEQKKKVISEYKEKVVEPAKKEIKKTQADVEAVESEKAAYEQARKLYSKGYPSAYATGRVKQYLKEFYASEEAARVAGKQLEAGEVPAGIEKTLKSLEARGLTREKALQTIGLKEIEVEDTLTMEEIPAAPTAPPMVYLQKEEPPKTAKQKVVSFLKETFAPDKKVADAYVTGIGGVGAMAVTPSVSAGKETLITRPPTLEEAKRIEEARVAGEFFSISPKEIEVRAGRWGELTKDWEKLTPEEQKERITELTKMGAGIRALDEGEELVPPDVGVGFGYEKRQRPITEFDVATTAGLYFETGRWFLREQALGVTKKVVPEKGFAPITMPEREVVPYEALRGTVMKDPFTGKDIYLKQDILTVPESTLKIGTPEQFATAISIAPYFIPKVGAALFFGEQIGKSGELVYERGLAKGTLGYFKEYPIEAAATTLYGGYKVAKGVKGFLTKPEIEKIKIPVDIKQRQFVIPQPAIEAQKMAQITYFDDIIGTAKLGRPGERKILMTRLQKWKGKFWQTLGVPKKLAYKPIYMGDPVDREAYKKALEFLQKKGYSEKMAREMIRFRRPLQYQSVFRGRGIVETGDDFTRVMLKGKELTVKEVKYIDDIKTLGGEGKVQYIQMTAQPAKKSKFIKDGDDVFEFIQEAKKYRVTPTGKEYMKLVEAGKAREQFKGYTTDILKKEQVEGLFPLRTLTPEQIKAFRTRQLDIYKAADIMKKTIPLQKKVQLTTSTVYVEKGEPLFRVTDDVIRESYSITTGTKKSSKAFLKFLYAPPEEALAKTLEKVKPAVIVKPLPSPKPVPAPSPTPTPKIFTAAVPMAKALPVVIAEPTPEIKVPEARLGQIDIKLGKIREVELGEVREIPLGGVRGVPFITTDLRESQLDLEGRGIRVEEEPMIKAEKDVKVKVEEKIKIGEKAKVQVRVEERAKIQEKLGAAIKSAEKIKIAEKMQEKVAEKVGVKLQSKQLTKLAQKLGVKTRVATQQQFQRAVKGKMTTRGRGLLVPKLPPPTTKSPLKRIAKALPQKAYEVQIRRRGKFLPVTEEPLPYGLALKVGAERTMKTLGQTFRLVPKGVTAIEDVRFGLPKQVFTKPKKPTARLEFVERRGMTLKRGTGEIPEILKAQKQSQNFFKSPGKKSKKRRSLLF